MNIGGIGHKETSHPISSSSSPNSGDQIINQISSGIIGSSSPVEPSSLISRVSDLVKESMWQEMKEEKRPAEEGGFIRLFKLKSLYNNVSAQKELLKQNNEHVMKQGHLSFPASELSGVDMLYLKEGVTFEELKEAYSFIGIETNDYLFEVELKRNLKWGQILNKLGYKSYCDKGEFYVEFPDAEALNALFAKHYPDKSPLGVISVKAIASHKLFYDTYLNKKVILSEDEFCHDQEAHLIPKIQLILSKDVQDDVFTEKNYQNNINIIHKKVQEYSDRIERAKHLKIDEKKIMLMEVFLGALVDTLSSNGDRSVLLQIATLSQKSNDTFLKNMIWNNPLWCRYIQKECSISEEVLNYDLVEERYHAEKQKISDEDKRYYALKYYFSSCMEEFNSLTHAISSKDRDRKDLG